MNDSALGLTRIDFQSAGCGELEHVGSIGNAPQAGSPAIQQTGSQCVSIQVELKRGIANLKSLMVDQVVRFNDEMVGLPQAGIEGELSHSSNRFSQVVGRDF